MRVTEKISPKYFRKLDKRDSKKRLLNSGFISEQVFCLCGVTYTYTYTNGYKANVSLLLGGYYSRPDTLKF